MLRGFPALSGLGECIVCPGCIAKYHSLGGLNHRHIFSQFLRLEVQDRLVSGEGSLPGLQIDTFLLWAHMAFPWCVCGERDFPVPSPLGFFIRFQIILDEEPTLMSSFNLSYLLKVLSPNTDTLWIRT